MWQNRGIETRAMHGKDIYIFSTGLPRTGLNPEIKHGVTDPGIMAEMNLCDSRTRDGQI